MTYVDIPRDALIQSMTGAGMPIWMARGIAELYDWASHGGASEVTDVVATVGKKKPTTFDQFAAEFAPAFASTAAAG